MVVELIMLMSVNDVLTFPALRRYTIVSSEPYGESKFVPVTVRVMPACPYVGPNDVMVGGEQTASDPSKLPAVQLGLPTRPLHCRVALPLVIV